MKSRPNVALIVETSVIYGRQILHGVARFLRAHGGWSVFLDERELGAPPPDWLLNWDGDGIICRPTTPDLARQLKARGLPIVDLNDQYGYLGLPRISSDMRAIGHMAATHLLERGFHNIAFCGFRGEVWSQERYRGVQEAITGHGELCGVFESDWQNLREQAWQEERDRVGEWLSSLPRPLGVVACNDVRGHHVLDACRLLDITVPETVAVVGVDNSQTFCELCSPPLSSVMPNAERIGYESASLLEQLMAGATRENFNWHLPPSGVVTRESSDALAIDDVVVAQALRFIRENACTGISVDDVLARTPLSRSSLERSFRQYIGRSPQEEIRDVRLKRTKQLLVETDYSLARIAELSGFKHPEYMMVQFKRLTGYTPSQWRNNNISDLPSEGLKI
ncbi:xylose operon regulatory protein [Abditibacteriota bacterium]|nr:xylose operon regulatory protein [Abditibacteriota bacterium]